MNLNNIATVSNFIKAIADSITSKDEELIAASVLNKNTTRNFIDDLVATEILSIQSGMKFFNIEMSECVEEFLEELDNDLIIDLIVKNVADRNNDECYG